MKTVLTLLVACVFAGTLSAATAPINWKASVADDAGLSAFAADAAGFTADDFLNLTPRKYREMTGERLGIKGTLAMKAAQKHVKKQMKRGSAAEDIPKGLYVVLAIFGLGWLGMGLMDDFEGNNWWIGLLLSLLCWIPGVIYSLIKMKDYY